MRESFDEIVTGVTYPTTSPWARAATQRAENDADTIQALIGEVAALQADNEALRTELADLKLGVRLTEPMPRRVGW